MAAAIQVQARRATTIVTSAMDELTKQELIRVESEWNQAIVENDAEAIERYVAEDWIIVSSNGSVIDRTTFLQLVESGTLIHDEMTSEDMRVRVYGDTAV